MDNFEEYLEKLNEEREPNEVYYDPFDPADLRLPTLLLFDTSNRHKYDKTPVCVYVRDGYLKENGVIRFDLDTFKFDKEINLTYNDQKTIEDFCRNNKQHIYDLANERIDYKEFKNLVKQERLNESALLNEKFILDPEETGLDRKMWIDNGRTGIEKSKHNSSLRIKIEVPKGDNDSKNWSSILLSPEIKFHDKHKFDMNDREKAFITKFIEKNYEQIVSASLGNYTSKDVFIKRISKIKKNGDFINPEIRDQNYKIVYAINGISIVKSEDGLYNFMKDDKLICDTWFKSFSSFSYSKQYNKNIAYVVDLFDNVLIIDDDGEKIARFCKSEQ